MFENYVGISHHLKPLTCTYTIRPKKPLFLSLLIKKLLFLIKRLKVIKKPLTCTYTIRPKKPLFWFSSHYLQVFEIVFFDFSSLPGLWESFLGNISSISLRFMYD